MITRWLASVVLSALAIAQAPPPTAASIDAGLDQGFAAVATGGFNEVEKSASELLRQATELHDDRLMTRATILLGVTHYNQTKLPIALEELQRGEAGAAALHDVPLHKQALATLANTLRALGRYQEGLARFEQWRQINRTLATPESETRTTRAIGILYYEIGDVDRAEVMFKEALANARANGETALQSACLLSLAIVEKTHKRFEQAMTYSNEALQLARREKLRNSEAEILNSMASGYSQMNRPDESAAYLRESKAIATEIGYSGLLAQVNERLAELEVQRGHYTEAIEVLKDSVALMEKLGSPPEKAWTVFYTWANAEREQAHWDASLTQYRKAIAAIEQMEEGSLPTELARALPVSTRRQVYEEAAGVEASAGRADEAFAMADRSRARAFLDVLRESRLDAHAPSPATVARVQQDLLTPGAVLLEYLLGDAQSLAFAISRDRVDVVTLPKRETIQELALAERDALAQPVGLLTPPAALRAQRTREARLYAMLIAPLERSLLGATHLLIVPDGALAYVPFDSFRKSEQGPYLIESVAITYAQSAAAHLALTQQAAGRPAATRTLVAFGDPSYGTAAPGEQRAAPALAPIPGSRAEVEGIAVRYPAAEKTLRLGRSATEAAVKRERLEDFRYVHFAVHGFTDEENPAKSGLALGEERGSGEDGVLHMDEIARLHLNADLVTLSACSTASGKLLTGEGLLSLGRAFFYAGARHVVATLWNVNDRSTTDLMTSFYGQLNRQQPVADALRQAKLRMLHGPKAAWREPHFWAPFVAMQ